MAGTRLRLVTRCPPCSPLGFSMRMVCPRSVRIPLRHSGLSSAAPRPERGECSGVSAFTAIAARTCRSGRAQRVESSARAVFARGRREGGCEGRAKVVPWSFFGLFAVAASVGVRAVTPVFSRPRGLAGPPLLASVWVRSCASEGGKGFTLANSPVRVPWWSPWCASWRRASFQRGRTHRGGGAGRMVVRWRGGAVSIERPCRCSQCRAGIPSRGRGRSRRGDLLCSGGLGGSTARTLFLLAPPSGVALGERCLDRSAAAEWMRGALGLEESDFIADLDHGSRRTAGTTSGHV
jgi:hypothetical protein